MDGRRCRESAESEPISSSVIRYLYLSHVDRDPQLEAKQNPWRYMDNSRGAFRASLIVMPLAKVEDIRTETQEVKGPTVKKFDIGTSVHTAELHTS